MRGADFYPITGMLAILCLCLAGCGQQVEPMSMSTPLPPNIEVIKISEVNTVTQEILQKKEFDQCESASPFKARIQFSQSSQEETGQKLMLGGRVGGEAGISELAKLTLEAEIQNHFSSSAQQAQGHEESVEIQVPGRTRQEYTILWREIRREGSVEYREGDATKKADYSYRIGLELVSARGRDIPCPGQSGLPPTPAPTEALATATSTPKVPEPTVPSATRTPTTIRSSFDANNTEGWTANDGAQVMNPGSRGNSAGLSDGYLTWTGGGGGTSYYVAPSKFHGDWRGYSSIKVDLWSSGGSYYTTGNYEIYGDIFLANRHATAQLLLPHRPAVRWESFVVSLTDDVGWTFSGGATSIEDILLNVTDFQIRAEYGVGGDESGLDNVELGK